MKNWTYYIRPWTSLSSKQYFRNLANIDMKHILDHRPCENAYAPFFT